MGTGLNAQDLHFSQLHTSPLSLNPALTGQFEGDLRLMNIYRSQWASVSSPYSTNALAADKVYWKNGKKKSLGAILMFDRSGQEPLNTAKLNLSGSKDFRFNKNLLVAGLQVGITYKFLKRDALSFPEQFNWGTGAFDASLPLSETTDKGAVLYPDVNVGFYYERLGEGKIRPFLGVALSHVIFPAESFTDSGSNLPWRQTLDLGLKMQLSKRLQFTPSVTANFHTSASEWLGKGIIDYRVPYGSSVYNLFFGTALRTGFDRNVDAAIAIVGANVKGLRIGLAYDVNISEFEVATNNRGAFELSLVYVKETRRPDKLQVPCDRY